jgi:hypothetical protein
VLKGCHDISLFALAERGATVSWLPCVLSSVCPTLLLAMTVGVDSAVVRRAIYRMEAMHAVTHLDGRDLEFFHLQHLLIQVCSPTDAHLHASNFAKFMPWPDENEDIIQ